MVKMDWEALLVDLATLLVYLVTTFLYAWIIWFLWNYLSFVPHVTYLEFLAMSFLFDVGKTLLKRKPLF